MKIKRHHHIHIEIVMHNNKLSARKLIKSIQVLHCQHTLYIHSYIKEQKKNINSYRIDAHSDATRTMMSLVHVIKAQNIIYTHYVDREFGSYLMCSYSLCILFATNDNQHGKITSFLFLNS